MGRNDFLRVVSARLGRRKADKFSGDGAALMHQLVETVLAVGAWLTEDDRASVHARCESLAFKSDTLSIAFHIKLLNMSWESEECLAVWQESPGVEIANMSIVEADESEHDGHVLASVLTLDEVLVTIVESSQELLNYIEAVLQGEGQNTDCRRNREASANPVPEAENILITNAESLGCLQVCAHSAEMGCNRLIKLCSHTFAFVVCLDVLTGLSCIKHGLSSRKSLRDNDEKSLLHIDVTASALKINGVHIGQELQLDAV